MPIKPQPWPEIPYIQNPTADQRQNLEITRRAYEVRFGPCPAPIVTVDIPPRPVPGRKTAPGVDPTIVIHPHH